MDLSLEMSELLNTFYESVNSGDVSRWSSGLGPDVLVIGTDEVEWWQGKADTVPILTAQLSEMHAAGITLSRGEPQITVAAGAVWAADRPMMTLADGTQGPVRLTLFAAPQDGVLLVQHMHLSVGTPNEDALRQTLTVEL